MKVRNLVALALVFGAIISTQAMAVSGGKRKPPHAKVDTSFHLADLEYAARVTGNKSPSISN